MNVEEKITSIRKTALQRKRLLRSKKALESAPPKSAKIADFQVLFRLGQADGRKSIFQLNWM
jgi:hypothetical protein